MPSCSVKWCSNHTSTCSLKSRNGVSFHRFPKDKSISNKWVEAVRFERRDPWWTSSNASRICSIHFKESDISSTPCKVNILAKTAVPVCTMVWSDDHENNVTLKTSIKRSNTETTILKTYERKKTNTNVLKESKANNSNNSSKDSKYKTNGVLISNTSSYNSCYLAQDNVPEATKLIKTLEESRTLNLKEGLEPNSIYNISLKTNENKNVTADQKKYVHTELNKQEYVPSYMEKCCKSEIIVKLNDNTNIILDENLSNNVDTIFMDNKVSKEPNTRISEISKKVNFKELNSNENREPNKQVHNNSNSDMFVKTIPNANVGLDANISNSFVGKILKTYLPKRRNNINEKNIREKFENFNKTKDMWSITIEKGLNTVKCKKVNNKKVNKYRNDEFRKYLNSGNNIIQSNKSSQNINKLCIFKNPKKYFFVRKSELLNRPKIRDQNKLRVYVETNLDSNKESNIRHIDDFIMNQSGFGKIKETDTTTYDQIISELFETSKNVGNISDTPSKGKYLVTNGNHMNLAFGERTNNIHGTLDFTTQTDTNVYTELNTLMDLELCNTGRINEKNTEVNTDKTDIHKSFTQSNEQTVAESNQQLLLVISKNTISESHQNLNTELKEKVPDQNYRADLVKSLQSNIIIGATKELESNVTRTKQLNSISLEEFLTNISPGSNDSGNMDLQNFDKYPNITREPKFSKENNNIECHKTLGKDMPDLNTVMNLELCCDVNIGCNHKINTDFRTENTDMNASNESNQQMLTVIKNFPIEYRNHIISESNYYWHTERNENITAKGSQNVCNYKNITKNAIILSNNELENLKTSVVNNIGKEPKNDKFTELKKHLSMKPKLDCPPELCINTLTDINKNMFSKHDSVTVISKESVQDPDRDRNLEFNENSNIDVNNIDTLTQNNMNKDIIRKTESNVTSSKKRNSILDEKLIKNLSPQSNNNKNANAINNLKTHSNTTIATENMISDNNESKKLLDKDMPELNTLILPDQRINENRVPNLKEEFNHLNTETFNDKNLLLRKSDKDIVNVLAMPEDQHIVVTEHMDVVNSILNKDVAADFDLSLLLSDTPIPDEDIQNVDNSNYNSLDGIAGSPSWMELPSGEIPKIIDDILNQDSQLFENLDLFEKVNQSNKDKESYKNNKDKKKHSTTNEKLILHNCCETDKQCVKNSIAEIEKQLISDFSESNETSLKQKKYIFRENKVSQSENVINKHKLQYLISNNEQCVKKNLNQIVDNCNEYSNKAIRGGNITKNQCQKLNNVDTKTNQIEDPSSNKIVGQSFEQRESHRGHDCPGITNDNSIEVVLNELDISKMSKKQYDKQFIAQTNQTSVGNPIPIYGLLPKSIIHNQSTLEPNFQEINKQLSKDFKEKRIEEVNKVFKEAHTAGTVGRGELNIGKLKRVIFEECYDSECLNKCKYQKYNSNTETHKKEVHRDINLTDYTPYDVLNKQQCNESSIDNFNKQSNVESSDQNIKTRKKDLLDHHKLSHNEKYKTKYKKIAIDHIPGQYLELRWKESVGKSYTLSQERCKRKNKDLALSQRKLLCSESINNFSQRTMAECPECGYATDDNDLMTCQSDVDLRITKPLSLINKDMLISLRDKNENNNQYNDNNNRVPLESVYAMELAYVTAIQALERKLKQKIALSEYRLKKVNKLSKINNKLIKGNITLMDLSHNNKV